MLSSLVKLAKKAIWLWSRRLICWASFWAIVAKFDSTRAKLWVRMMLVMLVVATIATPSRVRMKKKGSRRAIERRAGMLVWGVAGGLVVGVMFRT